MPMSLIRGGVAAVCALMIGAAAANAEELVSYEIVDGTIPASLTGQPMFFAV